MGKIHAFQPVDKLRNYSRATTKPFRSGSIDYQPKIWSLPEQIQKKLGTLAGFIEILFPQGPNDFKVQSNLEILWKDLDQMQMCLDDNPYEFSHDALQTNLDSITEMKNICDSLKSFNSDKYEIKKLGKLEHVLTELEHLIYPKQKVRLQEAPLFHVGLNHIPNKRKQNMENVKKVTKKAVKAKPKAAVKKTASHKTAVKKTVKKTTVKKVARPVKKAVVKAVKKTVAAVKKRTAAIRKPAVKTGAVKKASAGKKVVAKKAAPKKSAAKK